MAQGILTGGQGETIQGNFIDRVSGPATWESGSNTYNESWLNHDLYISGNQMTISNNFFGRSYGGLGIQALGVDNSLWDNNITYDDSAGGFTLHGNNNLVEHYIDLSPTAMGVAFWSGDTGNVLENSYIEAEIPLLANGSPTIGGFTVQNDTLNTTTVFGSHSIDFRGQQIAPSDTYMGGNTWIGFNEWVMLLGSTWEYFTNHQDFANFLAQTTGTNWEQSSNAVNLSTTFGYNALNAQMDGSMTWTGAPDAIRAYVAATLAAAGGAPVLVAQAVNHTYNFQAGTPISIPASQGLLAGSSDAEGFGLTAALVAPPANGQVTVNADGSFTYTPTAGFSGTDSFTYRVEDANGATATATVTLLDPPSPAGGFTVNAVEGADSGGQTVATFTDPMNLAPASYSATITWGDGSTSAGTISASGGVYAVQGDHTYIETGNYTVGVTVVYPDGLSGTAASTAAVADAALAAGSASAGGGVEGTTPTSLIAPFTDANSRAPASDFSGTINWGDGVTTTFTSSAMSGSGGNYTVSGSHQYAAEGNYHIAVTVNDAGGNSTTISGSTIVAATETSVNAGALVVTNPAGQNAALTVAYNGVANAFTLSDPNNFFGTAIPGATVSADGHSVSVPAGTFTNSITLNMGGGGVNSVTVNLANGFADAVICMAGAAATALTVDLPGGLTLPAVTLAADSGGIVAPLMASGPSLASPGFQAAGLTLIPTLSSAPVPGTQFTVISNVTTTPIAGTFADLPLGGVILASYMQSTYWFRANYAGAGNNLVLTAIPNPTPVVTVIEAGGTFNGDSFSATAAVTDPSITSTGGIQPAELAGATPTCTYYAGNDTSGTNLGNTAPAQAGTYTVVASFAGSTDYAPASGQTTFTIAQATPTVVVTDASGTYTGNPYPATAAVNGGVSLEGVSATLTYYVGNGTGGTNLGGTAPSAAGTYTVVANFAGSTDYAPASGQTTFTIAQVTPTVAVTDAGGTYTGNPDPATSTINGGVSLEGVSPTYTYYLGNGTGGQNVGNTAPARRAATPWWPASPAARTTLPPAARRPSPSPRRRRPWW